MERTASSERNCFIIVIIRVEVELNIKYLLTKNTLFVIILSLHIRIIWLDLDRDLG